MNRLEDRVSAVHFFPVKSCQEATINGEYPEELIVGQTGFEYDGIIDRGLVIADETDLFVSQRGWDRNHARRYLGDTALAAVAVDINAGRVHVSSEAHGSVILPDASESESRSITIFGPELTAQDMGEEPALFFSELLGRAVRLVKTDRNHPRMLGASYQREGAANQSAGADGRPFSIASQASLDYLHKLVGWKLGTLPLNRYRANIEIEGSGFGPFGEDEVAEWKIAEVKMHGVKALSRCPIPNFDQHEGMEDRLSTKLLARTRMGWPAAGDTTQKAEPMFAQSLNHVVPDHETALIKAGDLVVATQTVAPNVILKNSMLR